MPIWLSAAVTWLGGLLLKRAWPAMVSSVMWLAKSRLGLIVSTLFVWLGINFATIKIVLNPAIDLLKGYAQGGMGGGQLGSVAVNWMGMLQFDRAITMIISAIAAKHAIMQGRLFLFKRGFGAKP